MSKYVLKEGKMMKLKEENAPDVDYAEIIEKALPDLENLLYKKTKIKTKLEVEKESGRNGYKYTIFSKQDFSKEMGPMGEAVFKKFFISFWGGKKLDKEESIWFSPHVQYEMVSGGSNGSEFAWSAVWLMLETGKWTVRD